MLLTYRDILQVSANQNKYQGIPRKRNSFKQVEQSLAGKNMLEDDGVVYLTIDQVLYGLNLLGKESEIANLIEREVKGARNLFEALFVVMKQIRSYDFE